MNIHRLLATGQILTLALTIAGGWGAYTGGREYYLASESVNWPIVKGQVSQSDLVRKTSGRFPHNTKAEVEYVYSAGGKQHTGRNVSYAMGHGPHEIARRYPVGENVDVRFLPSDPTESVLEPGAGNDLLILPACAGLIACFGILFGILIFRARVRFRPARQSITAG